jgi:hypothetical protein
MLQAAASTAGQEFTARTDLVVVDAVVTDRHERPVRGLTRDDFVIREQGTVRTVETFEAVDHPAVKEPPGPTSTAVSLADPRAEPHIVIYVDDVDVTRPQAERAAAGGGDRRRWADLRPGLAGVWETRRRRRGPGARRKRSTSRRAEVSRR